MSDSPNKSPSVAVTGASGFIGRAVLRELARRGIEAVVCARTVRGSGSTEPDKHRWVALDIHQVPEAAFERLGCPDVLIHLAWGGLPHYRALHHIEHELPGQYRFLGSLIKAGLPSLTVAGTCFEYGMQSGALHEDLPTQPNNPYGFAKDALRKQLQFLQAAHPYALTWARLFYLYGPGQAETSLLPQLRRAVASGAQVFNMSGGEQLRDFLPIGTAAQTLVTLALSGRQAGVVNLCAGVPVSVRRLVESWIADNGWSIGLNLGHYPYPDYEPMAFWGDRRKLDHFLDTP